MVIEIPEKCEFTAGSDQLTFNTQTNGDSLCIRRLHFDSEQAAILAHLINRPQSTTLKIKIKEE